MEKNDGGPAFPHVFEVEPTGNAYRAFNVEHGMSLRDAFAIAALQGMMAPPIHAGAPDTFVARNFTQIAYEAFQVADAMLRERDK